MTGLGTPRSKWPQNEQKTAEVQRNNEWIFQKGRQKNTH